MKMSARKEPVKPFRYSANNAKGPEFSNRAVYFISKQPTADIVDIVLNLMDADGPAPMKNMRPTKKNRNGADQFYLDHHAEYEARGKVSRDKVARVLTHNSACPKMYDELKKRRSTSKPVPVISHRNLGQAKCYQNSEICVKLNKKQAKRETRKTRTRPRTYTNFSQKQPRDKTKVTKPKRPQRRTRNSSKYKLSKIRLNKCCQCTTYWVPAEKKSASTFKQFVSPLEIAATSNFPNSQTFDPKQSQTPPKQNSKSNVGPGSGPGTRETSISSYNSFMSMDHEPMVQ